MTNKIDNKDKTSHPAAQLRAACVKYLKSINTRDAYIVKNRILAPIRAQKPITLRALGKRFKVSSESCRSFEMRLKKQIVEITRTHILYCAQLLKLQPIICPADFLAPIQDALQTPASEAAKRSKNNANKHAENCALYAIYQHFGYILRNGMLLNAQGQSILEDAKSFVRRHVDNAGLIDQEMFARYLQKSDTPKKDATYVYDLANQWTADIEQEAALIEHLSWIAEEIGLTKMHTSWSLRNTGKAWVKAALIEIGEPASVDVIAERADVPVHRARANLSANRPFVHKTNKQDWSVDAWGYQMYRSGPDEIEKFIRANGGKVSVNVLADEISKKWGILKRSAVNYLNGPQFEIVQGQAMLKDTPKDDTPLRDIDEITRQENGYRYWPFPVTERLLRGHCIQQFPREIAAALGCRPSEKKAVALAGHPATKPLTIRRPLTGTGGCTLGHLREPLQALNAKPGDEAWLVLGEDGAADLILASKRNQAA